MQDETETEDEGGQLVAVPKRNRQPMIKPNPTAGIRFQEHVWVEEERENFYS